MISDDELLKRVMELYQRGQPGRGEESLAKMLGVSRYRIGKTLHKIERMQYTGEFKGTYMAGGVMPEPDSLPLVGVTGPEQVILPRREPLVQPGPVEIHGVTAQDSQEQVNINTLWNAVIAAGQEARVMQRRKGEQRISLPNEPVALAFLSDLHFGGLGVDYQAAKQDAELVRDTPGMYAILHGDLRDNWLVPKLMHLQRTQAVNYDGETMLYRDYMRILKSKLLAVVSGNHDLWSYAQAGIDPMADLLFGAPVLYDKYQVAFTLQHGDRNRKVVVRHKWRYGSANNPVAGMIMAWQRGDIDFDIAVGGHTHQGSYCIPFYGHTVQRLCILTGTYKFQDDHAAESGFPSPKGNGCGALVFYPDGRMQWCYDLQTAADFVGYLRRKYNAA